MSINQEIIEEFKAELLQVQKILNTEEDKSMSYAPFIVSTDDLEYSILPATSEKDFLTLDINPREPQTFTKMCAYMLAKKFNAFVYGEKVEWKVFSKQDYYKTLEKRLEDMIFTFKHPAQNDVAQAPDPLKLTQALKEDYNPAIGFYTVFFKEDRYRGCFGVEITDNSSILADKKFKSGIECEDFANNFLKSVGIENYTLKAPLSENDKIQQNIKYIIDNERPEESENQSPKKKL